MRRRPVLCIEMAYDDYDGFDQQVPSRIERVRFASAEKAEEAKNQLMEWLEATVSDDTLKHFHFWVERKPDHEGKAQAVELLTNMADHYTGANLTLSDL